MEKLFLIFNRKEWELWRNSPETNFVFSDEELDRAEKSEKGFIGIRNGVDCYLSYNNIRISP